MAQGTKQIRRAVMGVNLDMLKDALRLPKDVTILTAVPSESTGLEFNALTLLLAGDRFQVTEAGRRFPTVCAKFQGTDIRGGGFKFDRFEKVED